MKNTYQNNESDNTILTNINDISFNSMITNKTILDNNYSHNKKVDLLTRYYLYYYIAIESFIYETSLDQDYFVHKVKNIGITFKPLQVLKLIENLLIHFPNKDKGYKSLKKTALLHGLKEFIKNDKDLFNSHYYLEQKKQQIKNDTLFDNTMSNLFEQHYLNVFNYFNTLLQKLTLKKSS